MITYHGKIVAVALQDFVVHAKAGSAGWAVGVNLRHVDALSREWPDWAKFNLTIFWRKFLALEEFF
jgi:hypothetical protein